MRSLVSLLYKQQKHCQFNTKSNNNIHSYEEIAAHYTAELKRTTAITGQTTKQKKNVQPNGLGSM